MSERDVRDVRPSALNDYEEEDKVLRTLSKATRRVKIELNHTWNIRLLPVQMGAEKKPFVRIAQHWQSKKPLYCPRYTSPSWGGNPEANCPVCTLSDALADSGDDLIKDISYNARCAVRFRFWCLVFDKEDHRGKIEEMPWDEIIDPYEFEMFKTTWEDYKKFQKWATTQRRGGPTIEGSLGMLDMDTGFNLLATHGARGIRLDRQAPSPLFDLEGKQFDDAVAKVWSRIRKPIITMPTLEQLTNMAMKFEEEAEGGSRRGTRRGGNRRDEPSEDRGGGGSRRRAYGEDQEPEERGNRRSRVEEDADPYSPSSRSRRAVDDQDADAPPPRSSRTRAEEPEGDAPGDTPPPRRRASSSDVLPPPSRRQAEPAADDDDPNAVTDADMDSDQIAGAEVPPRRQAAPAPPEPPARRSAPPPRRQAPAAEQAPARRTESIDASVPPPRRRAAAPEPVTEPETDASGEDADPGDAAEEKEAPAEEKQAPARRSAAPTSTGVDEAEDNVPEEERDPAPPVKEKVEEAPPQVSATAPAPSRSPEIKNRLDRLTRRGA